MKCYWGKTCCSRHIQYCSGEIKIIIKISPLSFLTGDSTAWFRFPHRHWGRDLPWNLKTSSIHVRAQSQALYSSLEKYLVLAVYKQKEGGLYNQKMFVLKIIATLQIVPWTCFQIGTSIIENNNVLCKAKSHCTLHNWFRVPSSQVSELHMPGFMLVWKCITIYNTILFLIYYSFTEKWCKI